MAKINNYEFDLAYESYNSNVHELSAVYFRLLYNYPNHESANFWNKRKEYWNEYKAKQTKLGFKAFKSLEALEKESSIIWSEWVLSKDLELALSANKPKAVKKKVETISSDKFLEVQYGKVGTKKRALNNIKIDKIEKEMVKKEKEKIKKHDKILASTKDKEIFFNELLNPSKPNKALKDANVRYKKNHNK